MTVVFKSEARRQKVKVKGGFNFEYVRLNSPAVIEGVLRNAERKVADEPKWQTQPCGLFANYADVSGRLVPQNVANKDVSIVDRRISNYLNRWFKFKPKLNKLRYTTYVLEGKHSTFELNDSAIMHMNRIKEGCGVPSLWNGKHQDLYFFFCREGEVYVDKMLIGRNMGSVQVYAEPNFPVVQLLHNEVTDRNWWHGVFDICQKQFKDIVDTTDFEEMIERWNPNVKGKLSKPSWANEVALNTEFPSDLQSLMDMHFEDTGATDVTEFSWKWWYNFFVNPYIHRYYKNLAFNLVMHWYAKAGNTFDEMVRFQHELIDLDYTDWVALEHGAFHLDNAAGVGVGGRDSTGVISVETTGRACEIVTQEDKQRNVARGLTASLSMYEDQYLKDWAQQGADNLIVDNGERWLDNKECLSGCDSKNSDQQVGISVNLASYCTAARETTINALSMVSGEEYTSPGNGKHGRDCAKKAGVLHMVRSLAGDDHGLKIFDPKPYLEAFSECFKWTFPALSDKQTLDKKGEKGWRHYVFNLGNTSVYDMGGEFLFQGRAFKLIKTEQTPIGMTKGNTYDWYAREFAKESLDNVIQYEAPLWYCETKEEFTAFLRPIIETKFYNVLADVPGSLAFLN